MFETRITVDPQNTSEVSVLLHPHDIARPSPARSVAMATVLVVSLGFWVAMGHVAGLI